jgi:hypothetical protein
MQKRIIRRLVSVATLFVVLGTTTRAAAIDVSGDYVGFNLAPFTVSVVQAGTLLQVSGSVVFEAVPYPFFATGTVDPSTGAVSVTGAIQTLCADFAFSGTGDGEELTGTAIAHCVNGTQGPGGFLLTKCGNGVIDPLETCDPGSAGVGPCCLPRCQSGPAGTACTSDGNDCTADVCNGPGTCTHRPRRAAARRRITGPAWSDSRRAGRCVREVWKHVGSVGPLVPQAAHARRMQPAFAPSPS